MGLTDDEITELNLRAWKVIADHAPEGELSVCILCRTSWPCPTALEASDFLEDQVSAQALRDAAEAWRGEGHAVMFNRAGGDLRPEQRVRKWIQDRADELERGGS